MIKIVGLGEYAVSGSHGDTIMTHALASCVAVTAYSPSQKAAGMVHIVLPGISQNQKNGLGTCYYAVTGIPLMLDRLCSDFACRKSELWIRLFGGANSIRKEDIFKLGQKNRLMVEKVLKNMNLSYDASETGGNLSRTIVMDVATGEIIIKSQPIMI